MRSLPAAGNFSERTSASHRWTLQTSRSPFVPNQCSRAPQVYAAANDKHWPHGHPRLDCRYVRTLCQHHAASGDRQAGEGRQPGAERSAKLERCPQPTSHGGAPPSQDRRAPSRPAHLALRAALGRRSEGCAQADQRPRRHGGDDTAVPCRLRASL